MKPQNVTNENFLMRSRESNPEYTRLTGRIAKQAFLRKQSERSAETKIMVFLEQKRGMLLQSV